MRIETRFAWIIAFCLLFGVTVAGLTSYRLESAQARAEVKQKADLLLETALAVRSYTVDEIAPTLAGDAAHFHSAQIPSFAAQSTLKRLAAKFPDYRYRESSLNPTNVQDRATDWEVGLLRRFSDDATLTEQYGELGTGADRHFYVARPIRLKAPECLQCHSTAAAAPPEMLAKYGHDNGFGWRLGEVVGLQLVEVPTAATDQKALNSVLVTIGSLTSILVLSAVIFLLLLRRYVTHPLETLTRVAHASSLSSAPAETSAPAPAGQFADLHHAIMRLQISVTRALSLIERRNGGSGGGPGGGPSGGIPGEASGEVPSEAR